MTTFHSHIWPALQTMVKESRPIDCLYVVSGFIGSGAASVLKNLKHSGRIKSIRLLIGLASPTTAIPENLAAELDRLRRLGSVRICAGLHSKIYLADTNALFIGSSNFSRLGFGGQHEAGVLTNEKDVVIGARKYVDDLWRNAFALPTKLRTYEAFGSIADAGVNASWLGSVRTGHECPFPRLMNEESSAFSDAARGKRANAHTDRIGKHQFRIVAFDPWQLDSVRWGFDAKAVNTSHLSWGTAKSTVPGDRFIFCVTKNLKYVGNMKDDSRVDAVHSIWKATDPSRPLKSEHRYPIQTWFKRLVRLRNPVPKAQLFDGGILTVNRWPQGVQGKLLQNEDQIHRLAEILAGHNPAQRKQIRDALDLEAFDKAAAALAAMGGTMPHLAPIVRRRIGVTAKR